MNHPRTEIRPNFCEVLNQVPLKATIRLTTKYDMFSTTASVGIPIDVNISIPFRVSSVASLEGVVTTTDFVRIRFSAIEKEEVRN